MENEKYSLHKPENVTALLVLGLMVGLTKPLLQHPRHWSPGHMAEQGEQVRRPLHGEAWDGVDTPMGKVSKRSSGWKGCD